ncbi:MAG: hypothetical protein ACK515_01735, partial [bacterium]
SGHYTADFGRAVEDEVCVQYKQQMLTGPATECGRRAYYSFDEYLKPDIMDWGAMKFMEVKPFSPSGIAKGIAQVTLYTVAYTPFGFSPDIQWTPMPAIVDCVFHAKPVTRSTASRSLIPRQAGHRFHGKPVGG